MVPYHGHPWVGHSTYTGGKWLVRPRLMPTLALHIRRLQALGTGHIICAGVTQDLHSRGTAHTGQRCVRHTALGSAKVQEGQHSPKLTAVRTDRESLVEKRALPHPVLQTGTAARGKTSPLAAAVLPQTHFVSWPPHGGFCSSHKPFPYLPHHSEDTHAHHQPSQLSPTAQGQPPTEQGSNCKPEHPPQCHHRLPLLPPAMLLQ